MTVKYLSNGNDDGTSVAQSATDKLHLYGGTPVVQPSAITSKGSTAASLKAGLNAVIVALRAIGAIAS